jgi:hypothetical protein
VKAMMASHTIIEGSQWMIAVVTLSGLIKRK